MHDTPPHDYATQDDSACSLGTRRSKGTVVVLCCVTTDPNGFRQLVGSPLKVAGKGLS